MLMHWYPHSFYFYPFHSHKNYTEYAVAVSIRNVPKYGKEWLHRRILGWCSMQFLLILGRLRTGISRWNQSKHGHRETIWMLSFRWHPRWSGTLHLHRNILGLYIAKQRLSSLHRKIRRKDSRRSTVLDPHSIEPKRATKYRYQRTLWNGALIWNNWAAISVSRWVKIWITHRLRQTSLPSAPAMICNNIMHLSSEIVSTSLFFVNYSVSLFDWFQVIFTLCTVLPHFYSDSGILD